MFQITNKNEAKPITKHISCDCKCKFNSTTCNSKQKSNNQTCQCERKNYRQCKQEYSWNPSTCICDSGEIVIVTDILSTKQEKYYSKKNKKPRMLQVLLQQIVIVKK